MKIVVATLCSPGVVPIAALTNPVKDAYCLRHGYTHQVKTDNFVQLAPSLGWHGYVFERWRWWAEVLRDCDAVFCVGTDVLITNLAVTLESLLDGRKPFLATKDAYMPNSDVMLVRNEPRCRELLQRVAESQDSHLGAQFLDQTSFCELSPEYADIIEYLPQRMMNSYDYTLMGMWHALHDNYRKGVDADGNDGQWQPGDFIFHCPGLLYPVREQAIRQRLPALT